MRERGREDSEREGGRIVRERGREDSEREREGGREGGRRGQIITSPNHSNMEKVTSKTHTTHTIHTQTVYTHCAPMATPLEKAQVCIPPALPHTHPPTTGTIDSLTVLKHAC